uniref:Dual serine/threonine and tyrosine protein kinase n=1 Tax=Rhipicephalus appendiculatus TaxID=34631 RepID=A0A131YVD8_RHIAP
MGFWRSRGSRHAHDVASCVTYGKLGLSLSCAGRGPCASKVFLGCRSRPRVQMKRSGRRRKMSANLPGEFAKFAKNSKYLRRIWRDTKASLDDIAKCGYFSEDQLAQLRLNETDDQFIGRTVMQPVALVVLGHSCWAKARVVNELFGQSVLPVTSPVGDESQLTWRMVRFSAGNQTEISLALPNSFELVEHLAAYDQPWRTIPRADLEVEGEARKDPALSAAALEIRMKHPLLRDEVQVVATPCNDSLSFEQTYRRAIEGCTPLLLYAFAEEAFTEKELADLYEIKRIAPKTPVLFIRANMPATSELTESEQHARSLRNARLAEQVQLCTAYVDGENSGSEDKQALETPMQTEEDAPKSVITLPVTAQQQLCSLGFVSKHFPEKRHHDRRRPNVRCSSGCSPSSELIENFDDFACNICLFVRSALQSMLVSAASLLNTTHLHCLRTFILTAFDMTRDMMITPKRLAYARKQETGLYHALMEVASHKQEEIRQLIVGAIENLRGEVLQRAADYQFEGVIVDEGEQAAPPTANVLQICTSQIQDLVLGMLNAAVAEKLVGSMNCLRESFVGTLERCLASLEGVCKEDDCMQASNALKQILNAAYQVEVTVKTSSSLLWVLWEKMKQLVQTLPGRAPPRIDAEWRQRVAADMLESLSEWRLARCICSQFRERLRSSHEQFQAAMRQLEAVHSGRLERTETQRIKVRKLHAPRLARCALESTSLRDEILYGMPQLGRELGRGQYGVVYSSEPWGGRSPCAVKSVVPPDDKHWNDLAMEFFYTRSVPDHDRIVQIRGSVIDHNYAGGTTPAVLLVMDRMQRDLYTALRAGLSWPARLRVALDVVQGIRFLHSQGLVHRDIKLKNVLLDRADRAKLTDLGFCKPEAMMSGSIVGTPIHMAPELFTGRYDNSVDTYAFGILFWYICAGHVKLPYVFEQCQTKDQLWSCVRKGARPERLPQFTDDCWRLMEQCWASDPQRRPLLGDVELVLEAISQQQQEAAHTQESQQLSESICSSQQQQTSGYGYTPCRPIVPTKDKWKCRKNVGLPNITRMQRLVACAADIIEQCRNSRSLFVAS